MQVHKSIPRGKRRKAKKNLVEKARAKDPERSQATRESAVCVCWGTLMPRPASKVEGRKRH